ncbi:SH3 domain-containing protein [Flavobacterium sp. 9AF]|uniref:SH3 domain-containing protein n=1 Tax=Flavobacterium sp. 9AF TaxID=2653142 RepID=UPI00135C5FC0|nr:SH3 domain-containing protein [Flavobacterium sp. 9AF]
MRTTLLTLLLTFSLTLQSQTFQKKELLASCCEKEGGRCTGSANCTACKNCSGCKHCSSGGSCGVCAATKTKTFPSISHKKTTTAAKEKLTQFELEKPKSKTITVSSLTANLRKEPKTTGIIVQKLKKGDELTLIEKKGDWIKVGLNKNKKLGWVPAKDVKQ